MLIITIQSMPQTTLLAITLPSNQPTTCRGSLVDLMYPVGLQQPNTTAEVKTDTIAPIQQHMHMLLGHMGVQPWVEAVAPCVATVAGICWEF